MCKAATRGLTHVRIRSSSNRSRISCIDRGHPHMMICSSLARNRSPSPVASCFFGRIVFSDAAIESRFASQRNPKTKSQASAASSRQTLQSRTGYCAENRFSFSRLTVLHRRLITKSAVSGGGMSEPTKPPPQHEDRPNMRARLRPFLQLIPRFCGEERLWFSMFVVASGLSVLVNLASRVLFSLVVPFEIAVALSHICGMVTTVSGQTRLHRATAGCGARTPKDKARALNRRS